MDYEAILEEKDASIANLIQDNHQLRENNTQLRQELEQLKRMIFGQKRERFIAEVNANQLSLFEAPSLSEPAVVEKQHIEYDRQTSKKKHPGRNELPDHLPVEEVFLEPEEDTSAMTCIGEEVTETLEYTPASLVKKRTIRRKYARPDGEGIVIAKLPLRPFPKFVAEVSLVAHILIAKFIDHLPFYRQIQRFKREFGWEVSDSTINEWFISVCTLLHPLYEVLIRKILTSAYLQADESPIKVLDQDHVKGIHQGYQWVYYAPEVKWVYFNYRKGRGQHGPKEVLSGYQGILQTDGLAVYDKFGEVPGIHLVGCLAHARRYFHKALDNYKVKSEEALKLIQGIYAAERGGRDKSAEERLAWRHEHVRPQYEALRAWIDEELKTRLDKKSKYAQAIRYINKQWPKLIRALDYGHTELDNNLIENKIRPLALGRKNYLFAGSHAAAERIAMMYSFFGSCAAHGVNPYEWLKATLDKIGDTKMTELETLLPGYKG